MKLSSYVKEGKEIRQVQVSRCDTKNKVVDVSDMVNYNLDNPDKNFEKVGFNAVDYSVEGKSVVIKHYMDLDDFMLVCHDISDSKEIDFQDYKGSKSDLYDTSFEARILRIASWTDGGGKDSNGRSRGAYTLTFQAGPGKPGDTGQVMMVGKPTKEIKIILVKDEARRFFLSCSNYFNNKQTAFLTHQYNNLFNKS